MSDNPLAVDNLENEDIIMLMAAAMQAPGVEGAVLGLPVLLWGAPGVGKTSRINKVARKLGFYNKDLTVLASIREPQDFTGLPIPGGADIEVGGQQIPALTFAPPLWAVQANQNSANTGDPRDDRAVVFFDEFATAGERVMAAMLRVIHERVVGEFNLNKNVVVLAAANPPSMSPGGTDLAPPVANRFIHLYWTPPTPNQWADWLTGVAPSATEAVDSSLKEDDDYLKLDVEEFHRQFGDLKVFFADWVRTPQGAQYLFKMPNPTISDALKQYFDENPNGAEVTRDGVRVRTDPAIAPQGSIPPLTFDSRFTDIYAWPSPRSLEIACRARAAVRATKGIPIDRQIKLENEIVCGTIGTEACMSINDFIKMSMRTQVVPSEFISSLAARETFFKRNPSMETQSLQLSKVLSYYLGLPSDTAKANDANFRKAILSFGGDGISNSGFPKLTPAMLSYAAEPLRVTVAEYQKTQDDKLGAKLQTIQGVWAPLKKKLGE